MMHIRIDITFIIYLGVHIIYIYIDIIYEWGRGWIQRQKHYSPPTPVSVFFAACVKVCCLTTKTVGRYRAAAGKPTERKRTIGKKNITKGRRNKLFSNQ